MLCGGGDTNDTALSCLNFASNSWDVMAFKLKYRRQGHHVSWLSKMGLVMIGGFYSENTTELLNNEGSTEYVNTLPSSNLYNVRKLLSSPPCPQSSNSGQILGLTLKSSEQALRPCPFADVQ